MSEYLSSVRLCVQYPEPQHKIHTLQIVDDIEAGNSCSGPTGIEHSFLFLLLFQDEEIL